MNTTSPRGVKIAARGLGKTYGSGCAAVRALAGADLDVLEGRFAAIMGPSGSGKSTMMHALAGLDTVDVGTIDFAGAELTTMNERQRTKLRRGRVGFVFQSFNLIPSLTARENIELPLRLDGKRPDERWVEGLTSTLGIQDRMTHRPSELSGGQQQRVAVARALASRPEVVFADEPTGALDSRSGRSLLAFLRTAAHDYGQTIVMVTHDPVAASYADRVDFLADGVVVDGFDEPTASDVLERMAALDERRLEAAA